MSDFVSMPSAYVSCFLPMLVFLQIGQHDVHVLLYILKVEEYGGDGILMNQLFEIAYFAGQFKERVQAVFVGVDHFHKAIRLGGNALKMWIWHINCAGKDGTFPIST